MTTSDADIEAFHRVGSEQVRNLPDHMETLIIPAGSRNSAVSILYGLYRYPPKSLKKIIFMHINKNLAKHEEEMWARLKACGVGTLRLRHRNLRCLRERLHELREADAVHLLVLSRCIPAMKANACHYINDHPEAFRPYLNDKTLFWIVGSEPHSAPRI